MADAPIEEFADYLKRVDKKNEAEAGRIERRRLGRPLKGKERRTVFLAAYVEPATAAVLETTGRTPVEILDAVSELVRDAKYPAAHRAVQRFIEYLLRDADKRNS